MAAHFHFPCMWMDAKGHVPCEVHHFASPEYVHALVCVCVCAHACVHACACACVRVCMRACVTVKYANQEPVSYNVGWCNRHMPPEQCSAPDHSIRGARSLAAGPSIASTSTAPVLTQLGPLDMLPEIQAPSFNFVFDDELL